ncbi:hypothetical protein HU200_015583 [Digitaria exilis]|uniref:Uncharacterized protein n=1 Tax=Digitaria exilis TaxID=1010633 RepID=A0A835F902_9POAL|nr:hypothetical protein HU200_015583 [Digitaria exilis]
MKCFPCLEKLYMKSCQSASKKFWRRKHRAFIKSFDIRLRQLFYKLEVLRLEIGIEDYNYLFFCTTACGASNGEKGFNGCSVGFYNIQM